MSMPVCACLCMSVHVCPCPAVVSYGRMPKETDQSRFGPPLRRRPLRRGAIERVTSTLYRLMAVPIHPWELPMNDENHESNELQSGFQPSKIPSETLIALEAAIGESSLKIDDAVVRSHRAGTDVVADVSWVEFSSSSGPSTSRRIRRTVMFLHRPDIMLPEFSIQARGSGASKFLLGAMSKLAGMPTLELENEPEFNRRFMIITANAESVRELMTRDLIDAMISIDDLTLSIEPRGVMCTRPPESYSHGTFSVEREQDERLTGEARVRFIDQAFIAGGAIADDPEAARRAVDAVEGTFAAEAVKTYENQGGLIGGAINKRLVTDEMLERLKEQSVPRQEIPAAVQRRAWTGTTFPLLILSGLSAGFIIFPSMLLLNRTPKTDNTEWIFLLIGVAASIGWGLVFRHRLGRRRLVIRGVVVHGQITAVEKTNTSVNDDPIHRITLKLEDGSPDLVVKMGSAPAKTARRMKDRDIRTWALVDPDRPARGLWIEGWCLESRLD